jgi:hypothetical protein
MTEGGTQLDLVTLLIIVLIVALILLVVRGL